eukprot:2213522-Pleurochrysis_carterae.AAC.2
MILLDGQIPSAAKLRAAARERARPKRQLYQTTSSRIERWSCPASYAFASPATPHAATIH